MDVFYNYIELLNKDLKDSLKYYTTFEYKELNMSLKNNHIMSKEQRKNYENILKIFEGGPVMRMNMTVYRGMTKRYKRFENEGFISTSANKEVAKMFAKNRYCCLYIITLTPGEYTILPLEKISEMPKEEEILLPPGDLSIQSIVPYTDPENRDNMDIVYCTYIPKNAEIVNNITDVSEMLSEVRIKLSIQSWVDRILESNVKEEIELLCEDNDIECILEQIQTLEFYEDIPKEAIEKVLKLLKNIGEI
jgi:hypothetical protein